MKKLFTLLLMIGGYVCTASAANKTIYVENTINWPNFYLYVWKDVEDGVIKNDEFPGIAQTNPETIEGKSIYKIVLEDTYEKFILSKANLDDKTVNLLISEVTDGAYYYIEKGDNNNYQACTIHQMTLYTYTLNITTETSWSDNCCVYLWGNDGENNIEHTGTFPGTRATSLGDNQYTFTFKTFKAATEGETKGLILSKGTNTQKTEDLSVTPGVRNFYLTDDFVASESVTTNSSGYCTFVNSNPLIIPEKTAYYAKDRNNGCATAIEITNPPAGTPMLIKGSASTTYNFPIASSGTDLVYTNAFEAGTPETALTGLESGSGPYNYILNGDAFYAAAGKNVAVGKAYLQLSTAATARPLIFSDDEETGINLITSSDDKADAYYNLRGQRVATPSKGLYIVNGRKVIMK